jgi:hypothetical protein
VLAGELADVAIFLFSVAEMTGIDLQDAVEAKLEVNRARTYRQLPNGCHGKDVGSSGSLPIHRLPASQPRETLPSSPDAG